MLTPTVQWILIVLLAVAIIVGVLWALRDVRSTGGGAQDVEASTVDPVRPVAALTA